MSKYMTSEVYFINVKQKCLLAIYPATGNSLFIEIKGNAAYIGTFLRSCGSLCAGAVGTTLR